VFDVIEFQTNPSDPVNFAFSKKVQTTGNHWKHYIKEVAKLIAYGEFNPLTRYLWIIPPNQEVIDRTVFKEYIDQNLSLPRIHTHCIAQSGQLVRNAGPFLAPLRVFRDLDFDMSETIHLDAVPTRHRGYQIHHSGTPGVKSEYTWKIPRNCDTNDIDFLGMVVPDEIDPDKDYTFGTMAQTGVGMLRVGPRLCPVGETEVILAQTYPRGTANIPLPEKPVYDGAFLVYREPKWKSNHDRITLPNLQLVQGVRGIDRAHHEAARVTNTEYVWVIDADCHIDPDFDFRFEVPEFCDPSVFVWKSRNNVNGLVYGNGGVKLMHRESLLIPPGEFLDYTESLKEHVEFYTVDQIAGTTCIDETPFEAWRAGLREGYKLYWKVNLDGDQHAQARLDQWCTRSDTENGKWAVRGARYATREATVITPKQLNDFDWLEQEWHKVK